MNQYENVQYPERIAAAIGWERFSLPAFCGVGGAKWGGPG